VEIATENPKLFPGTPSDGFSTATCDQAPAGDRRNTKAQPAPHDPTTIVLPSKPSDCPKEEVDGPELPRSTALISQWPALPRSKTYTLPP
jgi:hypothetical protein